MYSTLSVQYEYKPNTQIVPYSDDRGSGVVFITSFRLSADKWNFITDNWGCCPFCIGYIFFACFHLLMCTRSSTC